jgi:hypothetical protein
LNEDLDFQVCRLLIKLHEKWKPSVFGKIAQSLLAVTLSDLGWQGIRNHLSEDSDIDAIDPKKRRCTFEVKTSQETYVIIQSKDISCLNQRRVDGYDGFLTVMRICAATKWLVVPSLSEIVRPGNLSFAVMQLKNEQGLSSALNNRFNDVVKRFYGTIDQSGLRGLLECMSRLGIECDYERQ